MKLNYMIKVPCPSLSKKNVDFINRIIESKKITTIIEYGSGNSTLYFIEKYKKKKLKLISIENTKKFFYKNIKILKNKYLCKNEFLKRKFWKSNDYKNFLQDKTNPYTAINTFKSLFASNSRLPKIKVFLDVGVLRLLEKYLGTKIFLFIYPILKKLNSILRIFKKFKFENSSWNCTIENLKFEYKLVSPSVKDQFGEMPNREDYFKAYGNLNEEDEIILILIDGGPRHYIFENIIKILKHKKLFICFFDAWREEYKLILKKYNGQYLCASNTDLNGCEFYKKNFPDPEIREKIMLSEIFYFENKS